MIRATAILFFTASAVVAAPPARYGRIDVYGVDAKFKVRDVRVSPGAQMLDVGWRGDGMAQSGATAQARVRGRWREIWIEVVPEQDGKLQVNFQGEYYSKLGSDDVRLVWVDDARATGAQLSGGDFEELEADGTPHGWFFSGPPGPDAISRDGTVAASGQVGVGVWYGSQLRQVIDVRGGQPVRVAARFRAVGPEEEPPDVIEHQASFTNLLGIEPETVTVRLVNADAAARAKIRPLPLYGGAEWAVTSRWDDNTLASLKTREVLLAHGHRGTFFLNDPARNFYGNDYGLLGNHSPREMGRLLAIGGTTVGGHSLTHPMLSYQNANRIFEEVLGCRIALESACDTTVNAYAFSFCNYQNAIQGAQRQRDIATALGRAGYLQVANHRFAIDGCWPWGVAGLLPPDGRPIDNQFAGFLADEDLHEENPAITYSMHSWYDTPEKWAGFESDLDRYGNRPQWWYCHHNEYGAYRAQYRVAVEGKQDTDTGRLRFRFQRPPLVDLGDPIPLTFEITGVQPDEVTAIESSGGRVERVGSDGPVRFHLHHADHERLPTLVDHVATDDGNSATSEEFPAIAGALACDGSALTLKLRNTGPDPLEVKRVTYRLPLRYRHGTVRRGSFELSAGESHADELPLEEARDNARYRVGTYYFAAQVDFTLGGRRGRVYFTTRRPGQLDDASYPQQGFSLLGPIPRDQIDLDSLSVDSLVDRAWDLPDGRKLTFARVDPDVAEPLSAEVIPVRGRWDNGKLQPCIYLLASVVSSSAEREVRFQRHAGTVPGIWLGGRRVAEGATLEPGENALVLAYEPPVGQRFSPEHAGPMFRIVDAKTGERVGRIEYRP